MAVIKFMVILMVGNLTNHVDADAYAKGLVNSEGDIAHGAQGRGPILNAHIDINKYHCLVFWQSVDGPSSIDPMASQLNVLQEGIIHLEWPWVFFSMETWLTVWLLSPKSQQYCACRCDNI